MVKLSLQQILSIIAMLLIAEGLYARSFESGSTTGNDYQFPPTLALDLSELSTDKLFSNQPAPASRLEHRHHYSNAQFHFTNPPRFTLDLADIDLLRFKSSNQRIRYIRSDSGKHAISITDLSGIDSTTSVIIHEGFVGIGINERHRHFIFGKQSSDGEVTYSANWKSRF